MMVLIQDSEMLRECVQSIPLLQPEAVSPRHSPRYAFKKDVLLIMAFLWPLAAVQMVEIS